MKNIVLSLVLVSGLISGCSVGPSESDIESALQESAREEMSQQLKAMEALGGGEAAAAVKSMLKLPDPETITVTKLKVEDKFEKDNGDFIVKATFILNTAGEKIPSSARVTLTEIDGGWKVIHVENL
jgi:hypothetical protein